MEEKATEPLIPLPPEAWEEIVKHSHAATVIWGAAVLDQRLGALVANYMPNLSNSLRRKLFDYPGPLSAFSARIDVALALGLIEQDLVIALHAMRDLRNAFAHSPEKLLLTDEEPLKLLRKLDTYKPPRDPLLCFFDKMTQVGQRLVPTEDRLALAKALRKP